MGSRAILHIIDSLGRGGAESLLIKANILIPGYRHIVVYLDGPNLGMELAQDVSFFCLHFKGWLSLPRAIFKLRKLIRQEKIQTVHSHLFYSTIIARLACPKSIRLVSTYHSLLYDPRNTAQYSWKLLLLDRLTYRRHNYLLFVSKAVQELICRKIGVRGNYEILYNYVEEKFYAEIKNQNTLLPSQLRLVMLGNLRPEKNYSLVIQALAQISSNNVTLDIYGEGSQRKLLKDLIGEYGLEQNIKLKGRADQPDQILPHYDLYVASSKFEGFGIALTEAMASGLPCLVSDIPTHREIASDSVVYFNSERPESLAEKINQILTGSLALEEYKKQSRGHVKSYNKVLYLNKLEEIYRKLIAYG